MAFRPAPTRFKAVKYVCLPMQGVMPCTLMARFCPAEGCIRLSRFRVRCAIHGRAKCLRCGACMREASVAGVVLRFALFLPLFALYPFHFQCFCAIIFVNKGIFPSGGSTGISICQLVAVLCPLGGHLNFWCRDVFHRGGCMRAAPGDIMTPKMKLLRCMACRGTAGGMWIMPASA